MKIVEFLCKQHERGDSEATDLLYLQLHDDIRCKMARDKVDLQSLGGNDLIKQMILSFVEYPKSVLAMMLRDFEAGDVAFDNPFIGGLLPEEKTEEDIPF